MQSKYIYQTKDLATAAAIIAKGQKLKRMIKENGICWFVFENELESKKFAEDFLYGRLIVNARDFSEATKRLKSLIFKD